MAAMQDYLKNKILVTDGANYHVGLLKGAAATNEVTGDTYARQPVKFVESGGSYKNNAIISFPKAGAEWGTITHIAIFDKKDKDGSNALFIGAANGTPTITTGTEFSIPLNQLVVTIN